MHSPLFSGNTTVEKGAFFMMSDKAELLNFIYKNAQMGEESIGYLLQKTDDARMQKHLQAQQTEYRSITRRAKDMLQSAGSPVTDIGSMARMSAHMMVNMKTMTDNTPSHMAQMMIEGSTKGVIEMTKKLKLYEGVDRQAERLGQHLLEREEQNIEKLKAFLG